MCEPLQANVILEKFPSSWSDYRNALKHKKKDMGLQELISHMRTEEANTLKDKIGLIPEAKANLVENNTNKGNGGGGNKGKNNHKGKGGFKRNNFKKGKNACYVCGKPGHKSYQCNNRHKNSLNNENTSQVFLVEKDEPIVAVVEANLVENRMEWIVDTGATRHFCANKL